MDLVTDAYQTSYKKDDNQTMIYIALASLGAIVILFGVVYFMFFKTGEKEVSNANNVQQTQQVADNSHEFNQELDNTDNTTQDLSDKNTNNNDDTNSDNKEQAEADDKNKEQVNENQNQNKNEEDNEDSTTNQENTDESSDETTDAYDASYVYGMTQQGTYKISEDKKQILENDTVIYTAPNDYSIVSFNVAGNAIFVIFKTPEAYTYEFRKVYKNTNNLGGLFYKYYSAYEMTSFVVDPTNYRSKPTYVIFTSSAKQQVFVLKVENFQETGKKVVSAAGYSTFSAAYKVSGKDEVVVKYKDSSGQLKQVSISFEEQE